MLPFTLWTFPGYQVNWHHRVIANYLTQLVLGTVLRLILCVGPRRGKSELANRRLPAFALGINPDWEIIATSWGADLATDMSRDTKRIILDPRYHELFPGTTVNPRHVVADDRQASINTSDRWDVLGRRGKYTSKGMGGGIIGKGFSLGIIDDIIANDEQARSDTYREKVWRWYKREFWTRRAPDARIVIIGNRRHEDDLAGRLLHAARTRKTAEQWTLVNLREIREDEDNLDDPRQPGEVLWPSRYPLSEAEELRDSDPETFAALYQQRPAPPGGYECKAEWLQNRYTVLPCTEGEWRIVWDLRNGGKTPKSSMAVGQVWFRPFSTPGRFYLVDQVRGRWDYNEEEAQFLALTKRYPWVLTKRVENKADGRTLIPRLESVIPGIEAYDPGTPSKVERFRRVTPLLKAGNIWIPEQFPSVASDNTAEGFIHELITFPAATNDDQVDCVSMVLSDWAVQAQSGPLIYW
jgi:predicted phage terminase large subunit-like protein